nr:MAG TPA: hypothetical protein [Caudoviricetes sp.]
MESQPMKRKYKINPQTSKSACDIRTESLGRWCF